MNSLDTPVEQVMTRPVKTVDRELTVRGVSKLFASETVGSVVVETKYGRGILTTTDVMQELSPDLDRVVEMLAEG